MSVIAVGCPPRQTASYKNGEEGMVRENGGGTEKTLLPLHPRQIYHRLAVMCVMNFRLSLD